MKIFLSWSGPRSRAVAEALYHWLPRMIQAVKPFFSPEIEKGAKWSGEIDAALEGTRFGLICLTRDNLASPWIHYEAGALSKTTDALIWTLLVGITPADVDQPLGKFQHTLDQREDIFRLVQTINRRLADTGGEPLSEQILTENFELFWPKLRKKLDAALQIPIEATATHAQDGVGDVRNDRDILEEILDLVRIQELRSTRHEGRESFADVMDERASPIAVLVDLDLQPVEIELLALELDKRIPKTQVERRHGAFFQDKQARVRIVFPKQLTGSEITSVLGEATAAAGIPNAPWSPTRGRLPFHPHGLSFLW